LGRGDFVCSCISSRISAFLYGFIFPFAGRCPALQVVSAGPKAAGRPGAEVDAGEPGRAWRFIGGSWEKTNGKILGMMVDHAE